MTPDNLTQIAQTVETAVAMVTTFGVVLAAVAVAAAVIVGVTAVLETGGRQ